MIITAIQIRRIANSTTKMKGLASVNLDNMIAIKEIKVLFNEDKFFLAMPSRPTKVGTFKDMVHPINANVRDAFEKLIIGGYKIAEADGYSKMELTYLDNGKDSLLNQTIEDFAVNGERGTWGTDSEESVNNISRKPSPTVEKQKIDDSLMKWLES